MIHDPASSADELVGIWPSPARASRLVIAYATALELPRHGRPIAFLAGILAGVLLALGALLTASASLAVGSAARAALALDPSREAVPETPPSTFTTQTAPVAARATTASRSLASWYGPGFYGLRTACGEVLAGDSWWVAHRTLPCGTLLALRHGDRGVYARVGDRGPHVAGRDLDLTPAVREALGCPDLCVVEWRVVQ